MAALAIQDRLSRGAMARARQSSRSAKAWQPSQSLRSSCPMGRLFWPRKTRASVLETNIKENSLRSIVRVVFLNKRRVSLLRLAIWVALRAIPTATGPKTGSCPSNVVLPGLRGHITARDRAKTTYAAAPKAWETLSKSQLDPLCKSVSKKMRGGPRNGRFAQCPSLGLYRPQRHATRRPPPLVGYLSGGPLASTRCTRRSRPKAPLPEEAY